jgi:type II secretory pathway component PulF
MPSVATVMRAFDDGRDRSAHYREWKFKVSSGMGGEAPTPLEPFERALLTMAEESGKLEEVLEHLADFHFRQYKLILKVKQWLSYPMFTSLAAIFIAPLPFVFRGLTSAYWATVVGGLALWFAAGGVMLARLARRYQMRAPFVRARFARTLSLCIDAGLPLGRSAVLAAEASADVGLIRHIRRFPERTLASQPLSVTLTGSPIVTPEFHGTLLVAEQTGDFAPLARLAAMYEDGFR